MKVLVAGASGNLGSRVARRLLQRGDAVRLLVHETPPPEDVAKHPRAETVGGDLDDAASLAPACRGAEAVVHLAGLLFAPRPERFLERTNVTYLRNLAAAAREAGVRRFVLVSFPHADVNSPVAHFRTRARAERALFEICGGSATAPLVLRAGAVYGPGIKMVEAARRLLARRMLAVWRAPTMTHLLALPDFLRAIEAALDKPLTGTIDVGDERPLPLQEILDRFAERWGYARPWRMPRWTFFAAGAVCEAFALAFGTSAPLTRDFVRAGMTPAVGDISRMKRELLPALEYPTLDEGIALL